MFRAIGFVIALYAITQLMGQTFGAFQAAAVASFNTLETAAVVGQEQLQKARPN